MSEGHTQRLYFHPRHLPTVRDGSKRITMRYNEPVQVGPALLVFELDDEVVIPGQILAAVEKAVHDVTDEEAYADGFDNAAGVLPGLHGYYPDLSADDQIVIVRFDVDEGTQHEGVLTAHEQLVLDTAVQAARELENRRPADDYTHTVVSTAIDASGRLHTAANVHHFSGGPCAELAVLGAAAALTTDDIDVIVAVASADLVVLAPCGRCRQVLVDLHPNARVIVANEQGTTTIGVIELLPYAYLQPRA